MPPTMTTISDASSSRVSSPGTIDSSTAPITPPKPARPAPIAEGDGEHAVHVDARGRQHAAVVDAGADHHADARLHILSEELDRASGKHLTLNVTGALGALLCELGFPAAAMRGMAVVSRAAGLVAHTIEETVEPTSRTFMDFAGTIEYRDPE